MSEDVDACTLAGTAIVANAMTADRARAGHDESSGRAGRASHDVHAGHAAAAQRIGLLFDRHHERLYRLARRMLADAEEARDLLQDVFLRAASAPARLPAADDECAAWLVRCMVNACRDRRRRRVVRDRAAAALAAAARAASAARERRSADDGVVARATVDAALAGMPARRRAVIVLHELEERGVDEIAALLGIARVTVRWHLAAGRRELRARLGAGEERNR